MSSSVDALNMYTSQFNAHSATTANASKLQNSIQNLDQASDEQLMDVCKDFEAYFLEQVFKSMEKTVMKDENNSSDSGYVNMFKDKLTQEYAANATETGGYGIAQMLYESMKRQNQ